MAVCSPMRRPDLFSCSHILRTGVAVADTQRRGQPISPVSATLLDAFADLLAERVAARLVDQLPDSRRSPVAYTVDTLAAELGISPRAVRAAVARGDLDAVKRAGRWIIPASSVECWANTGAQKPVKAPLRRRDPRGKGIGRVTLTEALGQLDTPDGTAP